MISPLNTMNNKVLINKSQFCSPFKYKDKVSFNSSNDTSDNNKSNGLKFRYKVAIGTGIATAAIGIDLFLAKGKLFSTLTKGKISFISRMEEDIQTILTKDPAAKNKLEVLLAYPGLHALWLHRISHKLYQWKVPVLPRLFSNIGRFFTGIEIHPGAKIGRKVFFDHTGAIIGETAEIGNNVELIGRTVLGGTGKEKGLRHPIVKDDATLCMDSVILGRKKIGEGAIIGANTTVVNDVTPRTVVVNGAKGIVVRKDGQKVTDPKSICGILDEITSLKRRLRKVENRQ